MEIARGYFEHLQKKMQEVLDHELPNIEAAAELAAQSCLKGGRIYVFGTGHSHLIAEEFYIRAGGLALVKAILPPELMLDQMPLKSTHLERLEGIAAVLLELYKVEAGDTLIVVSNSGRNAVPVEMCLEAKKRGVSVVAMTSMKHSGGCDSRHSSGKKMYQLADVTIDNCADKGDASFYVEGFDIPIGPTSDAVGIAIAQAMTCSIVKKLVDAGFEPPVFRSANVDGGDAFNAQLYEKYFGYWK